MGLLKEIRADHAFEIMRPIHRNMSSIVIEAFPVNRYHTLLAIT
jgi:hypothetical protein